MSLFKICANKNCRAKYSAARKDFFCAPCRNPLIYLQKRIAARRRRFPGVDIDRIHYKLGKVKTKEAA